MPLRTRRALVSFAPGSLLLLVLWATSVESSIPRSSTGVPHHLEHAKDGELGASSHRPGWNASPQINEQGYLHELFRRIPGEWEGECAHHTSNRSPSKELNVPVVIRQVPGDGDCLFYAVAISLNLIQGGRHLRMDSEQCLKDLKCMSRRLRHMAVGCLRSFNSDCLRSEGQAYLRQGSLRDYHSTKRKAKVFKRLFIQGTESMATSELLSGAASQYGISSEEYCDLMEQDSYWGGGPEIVALCNVLKRPIHVYELVASEMDFYGRSEVHEKVRVPGHLVNKQFQLRRLATFGSPKYDSKDALHILSADSRFPDVHPDCIMENGNHFMAIFPVDVMRKWVNANRGNNGCEIFDSDRRRRVRGGGALSNDDNADCGCILSDDLEDSWLFHGEWFNDFDYSASLDGKDEWVNDEPSSRSRKGWHHKSLKVPHDSHLELQREKVQRQSMEKIIGFWINIFVWTLSHFHVGF